MQRMPAPLAQALLPFQREGVRFGVQRRGRLLLADEMGVGKTVQAIALASCYQVHLPPEQHMAYAPPQQHALRLQSRKQHTNKPHLQHELNTLSQIMLYRLLRALSTP